MVRQGDAQWRRSAPDPLHETRATRRSAGRRRTATIKTTRGSRSRTSRSSMETRRARPSTTRRRDLGSRRPAQARQHAVLRQRVRGRRPRPRRRGRARTQSVPGAAGLRRQLDLRRCAGIWQHLLERRRISSIGVSWSIYNSLFSHNRAIGNGGNPAQPSTLAAAAAARFYNDGNEMTLSAVRHRDP